MENFPIRANPSGSQLHPECISDRKSRFWQIENQPIIPRSEVICPQPRRVTRVPYFMDSLARVGTRSKSILSINKFETGPNILDFLTKDDPELDVDLNTQTGFFCGSPPSRANNPIVHDPEFTKLGQETTKCISSPLIISPDIKQGPRVEIGSPTCGSSFGGSPKVRIEGFSCGSPESHCIVPALA